MTTKKTRDVSTTGCLGLLLLTVALWVLFTSGIAAIFVWAWNLFAAPTFNLAVLSFSQGFAAVVLVELIVLFANLRITRRVP